METQENKLQISQNEISSYEILSMFSQFLWNLKFIFQAPISIIFIALEKCNMV